MAQGRTRTARPTRSGRGGGRSGGSGIPWLGLGLLLVIGVAVVAARTMSLTRGESARSVVATLTAVGRVATSAPLAGRATPQAGAQPKPTTAVPTVPAAAAVVPTAARARATPTAAGATPATGAATPTTSAPAHATPAGVLAPPAAASVGGVALTFDAGADRGYAEDILDLLQTEHVVASFGITGQWAKANPDLVRRMAADGHLVLNHTLDHRSFTGVSDQQGGLSAARRRAELEDADAIIAPLLGHSTQPWYRLPYGDDDTQVTADVQSAGYTRKVGWTVDSLGWRGMPSNEIVARCLKLAAPDAMYVFHVGRASQDAIALAQVIHGLRDEGFSFRVVSGQWSVISGQ